MYIAKNNKLPPLDVLPTGYETKLQALNRALQTHPATALHDSAGRELAIAAARQLADQFSDGTLWVRYDRSLAPKRAVQHVLETIIHTIDPFAHLVDDLTELQTLYHTLLADKQLFLIIDNVIDNDDIKALLPPASTTILFIGQTGVPPSNVYTLEFSDDEQKADADTGELVDIETASQYAEVVDGYLNLANRSSDGLLFSLLLFDDTKSEFKRVLDWLSTATNNDETTDTMLLKLTEVVLLFGRLRFFPNGEIIPYLKAGLAAATRRKDGKMVTKITDRLATL